MLELSEHPWSRIKLESGVLSKAFIGAYESSHMIELHYIKYIEHLFKTKSAEKTIDEVFQKATNTHGQSVHLWLMYMRFYILKSNFDKVRAVFRSAKEVLGDAASHDCWRLYLLFIKSYGGTDGDTEFKQFCLDLSQQQSPEFNRLKAHVLEILATTTGMKSVEEVFKMFTKTNLVSDELNKMMTDLSSRKVNFFL